MTNIYWPVYKNLESEMNRLFFSIHIDDNQLCVYSSKISDLILRAAVEVESISKELYKSNEGTKSTNIAYDEVAIKHLNKIWKLDKKKVLISSANCFQKLKVLQPFVKNEKKSYNDKLSFSWNNSYQNLKHDRANSLQFGSLKYLFEIMAALFILNLYYKEEIFDFDNQIKTTDFPINMGSEIFAIKLHSWAGYDGVGNYHRQTDFDECIYLIKYTDDSLDKYKQSVEEMQNKQREIFLKHPKFLKYVQNNNIADYKGQNLMWDVLGKEDYINIIQIAGQKHMESYKNTKYEGVLNKNCI